MEQMILIAHLLIALAIVGLILLQQGKGAEMGASFGAGASQTLFGAEGSGNVLTRTTALLATLFFVTSFGLAILAKDKATNINSAELPIPVIEQVEVGFETDLPVADDEVAPVMSADEDIPVAPETE
jgi:preprotein translocase subunit SecG